LTNYRVAASSILQTTNGMTVLMSGSNLVTIVMTNSMYSSCQHRGNLFGWL
jgi:hypothetical protein